MYREFLGLPILFDVNNPLTVSFGHRVHGRRMCSGWTRHPSDFAKDYDNSKNNLLVETQASNRFKHQYNTTREYDTLVSLLLEVELPISIYNPAGEPGSVPYIPMSAISSDLSGSTVSITILARDSMVYMLGTSPRRPVSSLELQSRLAKYFRIQLSEIEVIALLDDVVLRCPSWLVDGHNCVPR